MLNSVVKKISFIIQINIINNMFYSKYKLGRNHGLNITRISQSLKKSMANNRKPLANHSVNSFALLPNKEDIGNDKYYELHRLGPK